MNVGDRIRAKREELNMTQDELSKKMGYKYRSSVNKMEMSEELSLKKVKKVAEALDCDVTELLGWEDKTVSDPDNKGVKIPVLGKVAAGIPIDEIVDVIDTEEIPKRLAGTGRFFGLKIQGDSMEPEIHNGDYVIVREQQEAESGEVVIVEINGGKYATCKRLLKQDNGITLISFNPAYAPMFYTPEQVENLPEESEGKLLNLEGSFERSCNERF